jgi:hypothetical protein
MEGDATFHEFETYKQFWQRLGADFSKKNWQYLYKMIDWKKEIIIIW